MTAVPRRGWTEAELAVLRREWPNPNIPISRIQSRLYFRTQASMYDKACHMGIKRPRVQTPPRRSNRVGSGRREHLLKPVGYYRFNMAEYLP